MYIAREETRVYGKTAAITGARQELARRMMAWLEAADDLRGQRRDGQVVVLEGPLLRELGDIAQELRNRTTRARLQEATPRELLASSIDALLDSVQQFHARFGLHAPATRADLANCVAKIAEETLEMHEAIAGESDERVAQEAADLLYIAAGMVLLLPWRTAKAGLLQVAAKNDAKSPDNYPARPDGKDTATMSTGPIVCWHCGASPALYTATEVCSICGRPKERPRPGDPNQRTAKGNGPSTSVPPREQILPRIDEAIARERRREEQKR